VTGGHGGSLDFLDMSYELVIKFKSKKIQEIVRPPTLNGEPRLPSGGQV